MHKVVQKVGGIPPTHQLARQRQQFAQLRNAGVALPSTKIRLARCSEAIILGLPRFETAAAVLAEDRLRHEHLGWVLPITAPLGWANIGPKLKLAKDHLIPHVRAPAINSTAVMELRKKLRMAFECDVVPKTLASSVAMRQIRLKVVGSLLNALTQYPDADLCHVTVVKNAWIFTPEQLNRVAAATIKNQFFTDLKRTGTAGFSGPLVAFLHGEFDAHHGVYILHFHVLTTRRKATFMVKALRALKHAYRPGKLINRPIRVAMIGDRASQATYLLKGIWFQRSWRVVDGKLKRDRKGHRLNEPFHSLYLLWLDRHQLRDLTIMNGCWSNKSGGTAAMKQFYLAVMGAG